MPNWPALTFALLAAALASPASSQPAPGASTPSGRVQAMEALYPPWQRGANNDAADRGFEFTVPPVDVLADFHGSIDHPDLVLYVSGNYFFAVRGVVDAFGDAYPRYRGHVYYETLPPGLLLKQMDAGGTVTSGNMTWTAKPDVFMAELTASNELVRRGKLAAPVVAFATNDLTIMVPAGNPAHVTGLADLGRAGLALAMPNPQFEGVATQIRASLVKAGGEALAESVYGAKVKSGETILTRIHHRQTPLFLMQHLAETGVTWKVGGDLPGGDRQSHRPRRHSRRAQHARSLQRRHGAGRPAPRGGARMARFHPLRCGLQGVRALRLQTLRGKASIVPRWRRCVRNTACLQ